MPKKKLTESQLHDLLAAAEKNAKGKPEVRSVNRVCQHRCGQCLFGKNKLVSEEVKKTKLQECNNSGNAFGCHEGTVNGDHVICRGYYDEFLRDDPLGELMAQTGHYEFVK
jgi:hypothetical protein